MKKLIVLLSVLLGLVVLLVTMTALKTNPVIAENWANTFSRGYVTSLAEFSRLLPFSLTEVFFLILIVIDVTLLVFFFINLVKKDYSKAGSKLLIVFITIFSVIDVYTAACEFNYNRKPIELPYYEEHVDKSEYKDIYNFYATDLNNCVAELQFREDGDVKTDLTIAQISEIIEESYSIVKGDYFYDSHARAKKMTLFSWLYRELQITGVTFNVFGEPNVDYLATATELPFVVAHELAHTKGVMREDEANLLAFYVCLNSDSSYARYSAYSIYYQLISVVTNPYHMSEEDRESIVKISNQLNKSRRYMYDYWQNHDLLGKIGDWINNIYIVNSGVPEGTGSYSGGTDIVVDPETHELVPNVYQKLYYEKYYRLNS